MADPRADDLFGRVDYLANVERKDEAQELCGEIVRLFPDDPRAWKRTGKLALDCNRLQLAQQALWRAAQLDSSDCETWNQLGAAFLGEQKYAEAEACFRNAIARQPALIASWIGLASVHRGRGETEAAAAIYRHCVSLDSKDAATWAVLARIEKESGNLDAAKAAFEHALKIAPNPDDSVAYASLVADLKQYPLAIHILQQVVEQVPEFGLAWQILGNVQNQIGDFTAAIIAYRRATQISPDQSEMQYLLAMLLLLFEKKTTEATRLLDNILANAPCHVEALIGKGLLQLISGDQEQSLATTRHALSIDPQPSRLSQCLQTMHYCDSITPPANLAAHREWDALVHAQRGPTKTFATAKRSHHPLRIGFVSGDFARTPIAFLALPTIQHLDRSRCSVTSYSDRRDPDEYTEQFRIASDRWRQITGISDENVASQIYEDEIDVLIDLSGHFGTRLPVFAHRPASMQMTWVGYVGTTGISAMDFLLADRYHVRAGEELAYSERVLRLPNGYACYGPPAAAPPVNDLPAVRNQFITFGSFNSPQKYSPRIVETWAQILHRTPGSRLLLKNAWLGEPAERANVHARFRQHGIEPGRVHVEGFSPPLESMANYHRIDLALDTQPYSGGLTTCESLWMGVPVITFPGDRFAGRHATSYLSNAGYPQFIAHDQESYVELAVAWANRINELAQIRASLRDSVSRSAICNVQQFANDFLDTVALAVANN